MRIFLRCPILTYPTWKKKYTLYDFEDDAAASVARSRATSRVHPDRGTFSVRACRYVLRADRVGARYDLPTRDRRKIFTLIRTFNVRRDGRARVLHDNNRTIIVRAIRNNIWRYYNDRGDSVSRRTWKNSSVGVRRRAQRRDNSNENSRRRRRRSPRPGRTNEPNGRE